MCPPQFNTLNDDELMSLNNTFYSRHVEKAYTGDTEVVIHLCDGGDCQDKDTIKIRTEKPYGIAYKIFGRFVNTGAVSVYAGKDSMFFHTTGGGLYLKFNDPVKIEFTEYGHAPFRWDADIRRDEIRAYLLSKELQELILGKDNVKINGLELAPATEDSYFLTKTIDGPMDRIIDVLFASNALALVTLTGVVKISWIGKITVAKKRSM